VPIATQQKILVKLRKLVASGQFAINSRLPPERRLCEDLGVSRTGLRAALARLEAEGKLWRHVGKGTFVGSRPTVDTTTLPIIRQLTSPAEVMEVRLLIEPRIASLAALRATPADIGHMERCLEKLDRALEQKGRQEGALYDRWDGTLHQSIAESTQNALLLALFNSLNSVRNLSSWGRLQTAALNKERWLLYCRQHRAVVEAIASRDPAAAERAMRNHLETVQKNILDVAFSPPDDGDPLPSTQTFS